jgi:hypothetical protein
VRKHIDAVLDAAAFSYESPTGPARGGIRGAGSNPADAPKVLDGVSTTLWAPDPEDGVDSWWIELDLGRAVVAQNIKLVFAADGPPFSEFRVFVATGLRACCKRYGLFSKISRLNSLPPSAGSLAISAAEGSGLCMADVSLGGSPA